MHTSYRLRLGGPSSYGVRGRSWELGRTYYTSDPVFVEWLKSRGVFEVTVREPPALPEPEPEPEMELEPEPIKPKKAAPKRAKRSYVRRKPAKKRS